MKIKSFYLFYSHCSFNLLQDIIQIIPKHQTYKQNAKATGAQLWVEATFFALMIIQLKSAYSLQELQSCQTSRMWVFHNTTEKIAFLLHSSSSDHLNISKHLWLCLSCLTL